MNSVSRDMVSTRTSRVGSNTLYRDGLSTTPEGLTPQHASVRQKNSDMHKHMTPSPSAHTIASKHEYGAKKVSSHHLLSSPLNRQHTDYILELCRTHKRELLASMLVFVAVLLVLALVSYNPSDVAYAHVSDTTVEQLEHIATPLNKKEIALSAKLAEEYTIHNWLGYLGAIIAHVLYIYTVGYSAIVFPVVLIVWASAVVQSRFSERLLLGTALAFVGSAITASFAGVLQLVQWMPPMRPEWSGAVGQFIARMLWQVIGTVGSCILLTGALLVVLFAAIDLNVEKSVMRFKTICERIRRFRTSVAASHSDSVSQTSQQTSQSAHTDSSVATASTRTLTQQADEEQADEEGSAHGDYPYSTSPDNSDNNRIASSGNSSNMQHDVLAANMHYLHRRNAWQDAHESSAPLLSKLAHTLADENEPVRIIRRTVHTPNIASIRRDILSKYAEDDVHNSIHDTTRDSRDEVLSAPKAAARCAEVASTAHELYTEHSDSTAPEETSVQEKREKSIHSSVSACAEKPVCSPVVTVSLPQTRVCIPQNFSYPAQASVTFVEAPKQQKQHAQEDHTSTTYSHNQQPYNDSVCNRSSEPILEEQLKVHQRNAEHLAGLVAGQVAEEVAMQVAAEIAERVAQSAAQSAVQKAIEKALHQTIRTQQEPVRTSVHSSSASTMQKESEKVGNIRSASLSVPELCAVRSNEAVYEDIDYVLPTIDLLLPQEESSAVSEEELQQNARILQEKLKTFRIEIENLQVTPGPVVTQYEFVPASGVKVSQIENLADDIALALKARGIRIIAPVPGRGTVAVEIPNTHAATVRFRSVVSSAEFINAQMRLPLALGKTIHGDVFTADLAKMPHLLIAGATGSGKSVGINSIIASLLYAMHPRDLKFVIIDPKRVEMTHYRALHRHFLAVCPNVDEGIVTDPNNAVIVLKSVVAEMTRRYEILQKVGQRHIAEYNQKVREGRYHGISEYAHCELPYIVVIIDELADLMITASREVEEPICRLAQLARAVGIHLVVATQRPSVDVVTGLIKANFPARIAYQVASKIDSRTILDTSGAEHLLGNGDMLFTSGGAAKPIRLQNAYLSTDEVERICEHIARQQGFTQPYILPSVSDKTQRTGVSSLSDERDELFTEAARLVVRHRQCSTSLLQRRMKIGYGRAARIVDQLEEAGVVGPVEGSRGRTVLIESEVELSEIL
ncbi:MAG: DNA translocase FtsK 4TM domain-containing protein [Bacteroidota bacterium]|nr:DNA translocase FtsK 4TM domain-containing protein [Candidatus Kapabacteria bacterium]MDW8219371.1 DNA translocase FtsK 4TM domain-containing protein [Bacteroidota bacterium]